MPNERRSRERRTRTPGSRSSRSTGKHRSRSAVRRRERSAARRRLRSTTRQRSRSTAGRRSRSTTRQRSRSTRSRRTRSRSRRSHRLRTPRLERRSRSTTRSESTSRNKKRRRYNSRDNKTSDTASATHSNSGIRSPSRHTRQSSTNVPDVTKPVNNNMVEGSSTEKSIICNSNSVFNQSKQSAPQHSNPNSEPVVGISNPNNLPMDSDLLASLGKVLQAVTSVNPQNREKFPTLNVVPEFDPKIKNQTIDTWLNKVNECAEIYGWDSKQTAHFALPKLMGTAKRWYEGQPTVMHTWEIWQEKLKSAFPVYENYGRLLTEMLNVRAKFGDDLEEYYYEKLIALNRCGIDGKNAIDCVVFGIEDRSVRYGAEAVGFEDADKLLGYLRSVKHDKFEKNRKFVRPGSDPNRKPAKVEQNRQIRCFNCHENGHTVSNCKKPIVKCQKCLRFGHNDPNCSREVWKDKSELMDDKFKKKVIVNGSELEGYVDFGSQCTLIKESVAKTITNYETWRSDNLPHLRGFGNSVIRSIGSCTVDLTIDSVKVNVELIIVPDCFLNYDVLIGQTVTEQSHIEIRKDNKTLMIKSNLPVKEPRIVLKICSTVCIFGDAMIKVKTDCDLTGEVCIEDSQRPKYKVEGGNVSIKNGIGYIQITNYKHIFLQFQADQVITRGILYLGNLNKNKYLQINKICKESNPLTLNDLNIGDNLNKIQIHQLLALVNEYKDCFARDMSELGCTNITTMDIELKDTTPVVYRPYRLSHTERAEVRAMVDELLQNNIIRESSSPYASPIILVKKKTGDKRLCVDYRALNNKTIKQHYPIPRMEDQIDRLAGNNYFSTLDLASGYYQIPISEDSKFKTAFVTPDGQFEFNRMPFGLANAPAVFQRAVNMVLGNSRYDTALAYMDDILVPSKTFEQGLERLRTIFEKLRNSGLTLKPQKCYFFKVEVEYLGFEVSGAGIKPGTRKVEAVSNFPTPKDVHNVRQIVGLASFFRRFIKGFAQIARPLTKLLKKNSVWEWSTEQESAFNEIKRILSSKPVLALYDPTAETQIHTDASKHGVGGVLLQRQADSNFKPIAYYSRQTSPEESHFSSYELETLAVIASLMKFRPYVLGLNFTIVTDCNSLRATFQKRDMIPRVARWWSLIQEYDCNIMYRSGQNMIHVDALSRNPVSNEVGVVEAVETFEVMSINDDWLGTVQSNDSELKLERYNRTILDSLAAQNHGQDEKLWDDRLLQIQWGLNNTINKGTGKSPSEVLFGLRLTNTNEGHILTEIESDRTNGSLNSTSNDDTQSNNNTDTVDSENGLENVQQESNNEAVTDQVVDDQVIDDQVVGERVGNDQVVENVDIVSPEIDIIKVRSEVDKYIIESQEKQKEIFDKKRKQARKYQIGDLVRIEKVVHSVGKSRKLLPKLSGPYKITKILENDRYEVCDTPITKKGKKYTGVYAVDKIFPCISNAKCVERKVRQAQSALSAKCTKRKVRQAQSALNTMCLKCNVHN
ncbi:hypothetical protein ABMA27_005541 [Loxostege sticticalis]|uniref:Reverse transcriptase n=1 Tax=Loxostege sticticalis TaxID=481309 RepID=A0ABR3HJI8_LOXSC